MDFVTGLAILKDLKNDDYNLIFVIFNKLIKIVYYKLVRTSFNVASYVKFFIKVIMSDSDSSNCIMNDKNALFILKF